MADIDVVPKRGTNAWVWVLIAAIIVIAILWIAFGGSSTPARTGYNLDTSPAVAVASFASSYLA